MIDTNKYEGHTPAPWYAEEEEVEEGKAWTVRGGDHWVVMESDGCLRIDWKKEDALLTADAPLILEAYKRLRDGIRSILSDYDITELIRDVPEDEWNFEQQALVRMKELIE